MTIFYFILLDTGKWIHQWPESNFTKALAIT